MSNLCPTCSAITAASLSDQQSLGGGDIQYGYEHYGSFHKLEASAAASCSLCAMILVALGKKGQIVAPDEDVINDPSTIRLVGFPLSTVDSTGKIIPAKLSRILAGNAFLRGWLSIYASEKDPAAEAIDGRLIGPAPDSQQTMDLARFWLGDCIQNHPACRALISGASMDDRAPMMPTFVVDVGTAGQAPKLVKVTEGVDDPYVALSHVWGTGNYTVRTTTSNVLQMQRVIDLATMESNSLKDAISITRALGYAYLWVDSLCIVQDGPGFDAECARMGQIYENAAVVIAATGAANDHIGCLIPRSKPQLPPVQFLRKNDDGTASRFFINLQVGRLEKDVDEGIWASRAWLLQERILSRRTIHFAGEQIYWECATQTKSEDGVVIQKGNPKRLTYGTLDTPASSKTPDPTGHEAMLCYQRWCLLVAEYTTRNLTRPEDTLVALSGVATEITKRTGGTFLAGHWRDYLQIGLLWQAKLIRLEVPESPRAPTWSWASRKGPIFHDPYLFNAIKDETYNILSENVTIQNEDVHGKVVSGSIQLAGKMKAVTKMEGDINDVLWATISTPIHGYAQDKGLLSALVQEDGVTVGWGSFDTVDKSHTDTDTRQVMALCVSKNIPTPPAVVKALGPATSAVNGAVSVGASAVDSAPTPTFNVLLLQPVDSAGKTYQRVGMGEITTDLWFSSDDDSVSVTLI